MSPLQAQLLYVSVLGDQIELYQAFQNWGAQAQAATAPAIECIHLGVVHQVWCCL
jgi:hypothetical protein